MTSLFKHDDALILGIILSKFFSTPIEFGDGHRFNYSIGFPWGYVGGVRGNPATGAGGGLYGDNGKPMVSDSAPVLSSGLPGSGATIEEGGDGFLNGQFGRGGGGDFRPSVSDFPSCGGGGGWYGGGSGYLGAGGGGGSGYVNTAFSPKPPGYFPPSDDFYAFVGSEVYVMGVREGHGLCIINGTWVFEFTGAVQKFVVPYTGVYTIECWGAEGGGLGGYGESAERYSGGKGGYVKADFYFQEGTELFIYVGEKGKVSAVGLPSAWNGGGAGRGGYFGGGGATDVRWSGVEGSQDWSSNLYDRFIVAGGGGGQGSELSAGDVNFNPLPPSYISPDDTSSSGDDTIRSEKTLFIVSDLTLCTVDLTYATTLDLPEGSNIEVKLYVDGEYWGSVTKEMVSGGSSDSFEFRFSDKLPPDTPQWWAVIEAEVVTDKPIIIPPRGLVIRVSTESRPNDIPPKEKPILYFTRHVFHVDTFSYTDVYTIELVKQGSPIDDADNIVDEIIFEDLHGFENKIYVNYEGNTSVFTLTDTYFVELEGKTSPSDTDNLVDEISVEELYGVETKIYINSEGNISVLTLTDTYLVELEGSKLPSDTDNIVEDLEYTDVSDSSSLEVKPTSLSSDMEMEDVFDIDIE